ncbi:MAG: hypothetical protein R3B13_28985 [Polyangiaceae bacterium]
MKSLLPRQAAALAGALGGRLRFAQPLPFVFAAAWLACRPPAEARTLPFEADPANALVTALGQRGLVAAASDVHWIDATASTLGSRLRTSRAILRAHASSEPADVYLATVRLSPEGRVLQLDGLFNVSDTSAVDERDLTVQGEQAAWVISGGGRTYSVQLLDLSGEPASDLTDLSRLQRIQHGLTNLQQTGQRRGIGRRAFKLDPAAEKVRLSFGARALLIDADGRKIKIADRVLEGERFVSEQERFVARPGNLVTWAVDRVRALPWFGSDRMQAVKAVAFAGLDWVERVVGSVTGDDGSERVKKELGDLINAPVSEYTDPETGFPPPPMAPMLSPALDGEGKWRALDKDPFVLTNPDAPAPFVTSFIRTDQKRAYSQIFVTLWDPRQVALHTVSGTVEPKSATGETGTGLVPRDPAVISRLLAGFNGGFQATHGEFGMMADGIVYLPPKPYGATVAELSDGSSAFGTWPNDETVPDTVVSFRQNMTPLVMDGQINPYKRAWWGGVPPGWTDEARTVRSGVCLTKEGFAAYFYGSSIDADHLALAMQAARCSYGIHLDMNPGHTGLEFYRVAKTGSLPEVGHKLDPQWETQGDVRDLPGYQFLGRRMLRYMGLMNFPRYINRESRDFFYLTLRHLLPPQPLHFEGATTADGKWTVKGLPQHGFPFAIATATVLPDGTRPETKVRVLAVDPKTIELGGKGKVVLSVGPAAKGSHTLRLGAAGFEIAADGAPGNEPVLAAGSDKPEAGSVAALGIGPGGMLYYAVVSVARAQPRDTELLARVLDQTQASRRLFLSAPLELALGGERDLAGHPVAARSDTRLLTRRAAPGGRRLFDSTPIVPPSVWYPLQAKRVRYFRKPKPAEGAAGSPGATPAAAPSPETP